MTLIVTKINNEYLNKIIELDIQANLTPWSKGNYSATFASDSQVIYGLFQAQELVGFCVISVVIDEAEILQLVIAKAQQRNGLGYYLLNQICSSLEADGITQVFLEVRVGNDSAIRLYEKALFNMVGTRNNYYKIKNKTYDALLMSRTNITDFTAHFK
jgi:ribosomal-protein-alanine N-acetyltransferase